MVADDPTLLRAMAEGDAGAMSHFYDRHAAGVFGKCLQWAEDQASAQTLLADTFHQLWRQARVLSAAGADPLAAVTAIAHQLAGDGRPAADAAPVDPPHELKSELMTRIARDQDAAMRHKPSPDPHDRFRTPRRTAQAFTAAAAVILIGVLVNRWTNQRINAAREEVRREYEKRLMEQKLQTLMLQTRLERVEAPASQPTTP